MQLHEDKPVFLSIGYATCHWCHVMAHESFEDPEIAEVLNRDFICIKVDREERPDIDRIYMDVCQMLTGQGGWPLTIVMTPDKRPFFAATYLPKERRFSVYGLLEILPRIIQAWHHQRAELLQSSEKLISALQDPRPDVPGQDPDATLLDEGYEELLLRFDPEYGGFGDAPKFPTPHVLVFLLRVLETDREATGPCDGGKNPGCDEAWRDLRSGRRGIPPLLHGCTVAGPAFREDAVRPGASPAGIY